MEKLKNIILKKNNKEIFEKKLIKKINNKKWSSPDDPAKTQSIKSTQSHNSL